MKTMQNSGLTPRSDSFEWYNAFRVAQEENEKIKKSRIEAWEESCELEEKWRKWRLNAEKELTK